MIAGACIILIISTPSDTRRRKGLMGNGGEFGRSIPEGRKLTMDSIHTLLLQRITSRQAYVGILGLGYVRLPLAVEFAKAGFKVIGVDVDPRKVEALNAGRSYIPDVKSEDVASLRASGKLEATTDYAALRTADTVSICVPTPLRKTRDPDMSYVINAAEQVAEMVHPSFLVVLESTTYPGTTEEILQPRLEAKGFKIGQDVFLAFSPERINPGDPIYGVRNTPMVVGGATPACTEVATALSAMAIDQVVPVSTLRAAEMVKLLENTFRAVNIGLVNEMALMCAKLDVDVWEVIDAASRMALCSFRLVPASVGTVFRLIPCTFRGN
jgi:UDP-N-acetyl-D-glucosamine dehydrogenase